MKNTAKFQAFTAGISLITMAITAGYAYGWVHSSLITESATKTLENLMENQTLFLSGIQAWVLIFLTDLAVSVALYLFYQSTHKKAAATMAILRLVYTGMLGLAIVQLVKVYPLIRNAGAFSLTETAQQVTLHLAQFNTLWSAGLIVFGFHLAVLAFAILKSDFTPRIFGYLLYIAGFSYILINAMYRFALADPGLTKTLEQVLTLPMALGEILFAFWLIYFGLKKARPQLASVLSN